MTSNESTERSHPKEWTEDSEPAEKKKKRAVKVKGEAGEGEDLKRGKQSGEDDVEEASLESFPASDAPSY